MFIDDAYIMHINHHTCCDVVFVVIYSEAGKAAQPLTFKFWQLASTRLQQEQASWPKGGPF
jgi:hypothetical protein